MGKFPKLSIISASQSKLIIDGQNQDTEDPRKNNRVVLQLSFSKQTLESMDVHFMDVKNTNLMQKTRRKLPQKKEQLAIIWTLTLMHRHI